MIAQDISMVETEKLTEYTREINEMRRRAGENWKSSAVEGSTEVCECIMFFVTECIYL